ncbi:uncharacterized protein LOC130046406 isoform X1 [Ostrea edulis]|uniref:uncharacterized protein LOC130046406 isoform X1 n=1 Tax=Ostrea edulis TaxID=37623 RepID=UPI0024AF404E|nr:uncharacterized protein LOC130046406 isoform X1 [Ostrea edulis]
MGQRVFNVSLESIDGMDLIFHMNIFNSWRGLNIGLALLVLSLNAETATKGNCVNDGYVEQGGKCCTNFYHHNGGCIPCPTGSYGDNCSTTCPYLSYGENCGFQCKCSADEVCSPHIGCVKTSTASTSTTSTEAGNDMKSIEKSPKVETKSTRNPYSSKVDEVYPIPTDIIPSLAVVSKETNSVTPTSASGGNSQTLQVIIITGSVLSLFLIIIIINQIHGKLKKRRKNISASKKSKPSATNEAEEELYVEINESGMLENISRYDKIESQTSIKQQNSNGDVSKIEIRNETKPMLPKLRNEVIGTKSEELSVRQEDESLEERRSVYLDVVTNNLNESPDNSYLKPVGMLNTYIDVIGSPPKGMSESGSRTECQTFEVESPSICQSELTSQMDTYLEIIHE